MSFETVARAVEEFRAGRMVILVDDEARENEGDLCIAAEKITPDAINFMARYGRGLICLTLTDARINQLNLPMMVSDNTSAFGTAFTVSIEARYGVSTGISAQDRATTVRAAVAKDATPDDLVRPGHVFPLRAQPGGVLVRTGQTEGSVDLARLAGLEPAAVICEIMKDDGTMARMPDLEEFARIHNLSIVSIAELIDYRMRNERLIECLESRRILHPFLGEVLVRAYGTSLDQRQHLVVMVGDVQGEPPPLVRVHAAHPYGGVFGELFDDDQRLLRAALQQVAHERRGVLLCLDRGAAVIPLDERVRNLSHTPASIAAATTEGILREIGIGAQILRDLGLHRVRLLSNSPRRLAGIEGFGLHVEEVIGLELEENNELGLAPKLQAVSGNPDRCRS